MVDMEMGRRIASERTDVCGLSSPEKRIYSTFFDTRRRPVRFLVEEWGAGCHRIVKEVVGVRFCDVQRRTCG